MDTNDTIVTEIKRGPGRPKKAPVAAVEIDTPAEAVAVPVVDDRRVPVRLLFDTWIGTERNKAGLVVDMPIDQAKVLLAAGKCERADPLPGE